MEFSISTLLNSFGEDKLIAPKLLEKKLECNDEVKLQHLHITLEALVNAGILAKERGKYRRVSEEGIVESKLRCSSKGFCFAIQDGEGTEDIYIRESQLNTAWNGDRVLVKVTKEGRRRRSPEGEVRLILERANPSVLAHVKTKESGELRAVPLDDRLLFELALAEVNGNSPKPQDAVDQLVHVEILRYPLGSKPPLGKIAQILGSDAQSAVDTELVFCKYDLPRDFPAAVEAAAAALPQKLRKADQKKRKLLQKKTTLTISDLDHAPFGLDHGFSLEQDKQGNWILGIHVVDFTPFVPLNSPLDLEARTRAACITLGNKIVPLFPETFLERVGALQENQERLAFSLLVTCNDAGEVLEYELQPSVIKVDANLPEALVEQTLHRAEAGTISPEVKAIAEYHELIDQLHEFSKKLKTQRYQRGSFDLWAPTRSSDVFGDAGLQGATVISSPEMARMIVAECLTLANQLILDHMHRLNVPALYQHQAPPDIASIQDLLRLSENLGWTFDRVQENNVSPQDFQAFTHKFRTSEFAPMLFDLLSMTLEPVTLSLEPGPHFTQAVAQHFGQYTSPSHRYSDFLNQQVLHVVFYKGRERRNSQAKDIVRLGHSQCHDLINWNVLPPSHQRELETTLVESVAQINERITLILQAEKDLAGLQKTKTMQEHTGEVFQGIITGIQSYGFFVRLDALRVEGLVHVSSLKDDWYEYRSRQQTLIGRKNRRQYRLGDQVEVEVKSVDYYRQQIDLAVVGGGSEATDEEMENAESLFIGADDEEMRLDMDEAPREQDSDDLDSEDDLFSEAFDDQASSDDVVDDDAVDDDTVDDDIENELDFDDEEFDVDDEFEDDEFDDDDDEFEDDEFEDDDEIEDEIGKDEIEDEEV